MDLLNFKTSWHKDANIILFFSVRLGL